MERGIVFLLLVGVVAGDVANFQPCANVTDTCTVSNLRITPCPSPSKCRLKLGKDVRIDFAFTPSFVASKLATTVFWASNVGDLPWQDLDSDACKATTCPTEAGKLQEYSYSLHLGKKLPAGSYTLKWTVVDEAVSQNMCCFMTKIQLKK